MRNSTSLLVRHRASRKFGIAHDGGSATNPHQAVITDPLTGVQLRCLFREGYRFAAERDEVRRLWLWRRYSAGDVRGDSLDGPRGLVGATSFALSSSSILKGHSAR